ncbi:MAG: hypothetical protein IJ003_06395 [Candidatus Gastranaerophilales bacterium]|nr:hypothetical protein [Candidatus Gastranaerophilales bacterium]
MQVNGTYIYPYRPERLSQTKTENRAQRDLALKVLREAQGRYGKVDSSTYLDLKALQHKADIKYTNVCSRMKEHSKELSARINPEDEYYGYSKADEQLIAYYKSRKDNGQLIGNCGECAEAVQALFYKENQTPAVNICMNMYDNDGKYQGNHVFTITNFPKGILAETPDTWGDETIITDLWSSISMKKRDAFRYYEKIFNTNINKASFDIMPASSNPIQNHWVEQMEIWPTYMRD